MNEELISASQWAPNRRHEDMCRALGLDLVSEAERFIDGSGQRMKTEDHWDRIFSVLLKDRSKTRRPSPLWERHVTELEGATNVA